MEENRKFYDNYNKLIEVRDLLQNEVDILESFQQGFKGAKKSKEKEAFAKSVQEAISQVQNKGNRAQDKVSQLQQEIKTKENQLKSMLEKEREYFQLVKEFHSLLGN